MHVLDSRLCGVRSTAETDLDYIVEFGGKIRILGCRTGRTVGSRHMTQLAELHQSSDESNMQSRRQRYLCCRTSRTGIDLSLRSTSCTLQPVDRSNTCALPLQYRLYYCPGTLLMFDGVSQRCAAGWMHECDFSGRDSTNPDELPDDRDKMAAKMIQDDKLIKKSCAATGNRWHI